ncbi:sugar ABC transporter substrate-binding protein [Microbacterium sp.]|uniref:ABC transporter substrate-binding protein n=1 Tax=Microbacterium sp. TaxID=51671 RepID=UPI0027362E27|nr:sugar ABC transporter substrate-binding protein [Microbacterium sp.]MDP3951982.1 sugar ABC transporter substrate-binding protein [Microbacterium sp.]
MTRQRRLITVAAALAASTIILAGCSGGASGGDGSSVELDYWVWDANQQPGYEECVAAFTKINPDISVTTTQYGWDDYWSTLTAALVSGDGPDVFVNHLSYYPGLASKGQLLAIDDAVEAEGVDLSIYREGLADLWVGQDGNRYGLPKDYDTVAVFANSEMLEGAGVTQEELNASSWNPEDGGTWEQIIARLTVDTNGVHGDEPGFDKDSIAVYGLGLNASGGGNGQTEWSQYAFSNDWSHTDENPWGEEFNYGDPEFVETIAWFQSLAAKGYMPTFQIASSGIGQIDAYGAGKYAMVTEGSWNTRAYVGLDGVDTVIAPVPAGPNGERASMFNGLADSVASTTAHPEEAKQFAVFLASKECQDITAAKGIAFPAVEASADISRQAFADAGIDTAPFEVPLDDGSTYLAPVAENWAEIQAIMGPAMDAILSLQADPSSLVDANEQVNALFR